MSMWDDAMCIEDKYDQYEEEEPQKKYNGRYPKEIIEETEDLDFAIHILYDRSKKLDKKGKLFLKLERCIEHLKSLKNVDDQLLWLGRDMAMLQCSYDQSIEDNKRLIAQLKEHNIEPDII